MKIVTKPVRTNHQWHRHIALRALLALGSLSSLVLASGAGSHWH